MFYTIYKITNILDGKYYIGKHKTKDLNDEYFGSGKLIKRAIKKHGIENFTKEILYIFQTEEEMNTKEKELVTLNEMSYNLCPGGHGGWGYVNSTGMNNKDHENVGKILSEKNKGKKCPHVSIMMKERHKNGLVKYDNFTGKTHTEEWKKKHSDKMKDRVPWNKGKAWKDWHPNASVVKLVKASALEAEEFVGSSPTRGTIKC